MVEAVRILSDAVSSSASDNQRAEALVSAVRLLSGAWSNPLLREAFAYGLAQAAADMARLEPDQLRSMRRTAGITQMQLAKMLRVQQASVARWETGDEHLPAKHIPAILRALNLNRTASAVEGREAA